MVSIQERVKTSFNKAYLKTVDPLMEPLLVKKALTISEVVHILQTLPERYITAPPLNPRAGQVFLFKSEEKDKQGS